MSVSTKKLIIESYLSNELRKLTLDLPNDLYIIISKYYSINKEIKMKNGKYIIPIMFVGDSKVGKSIILLRYAV